MPSAAGLSRTIGAILGIGGAALLLVAARPDATVSRLPATLRVTAGVTGELAVTPSAPRPVLISRALIPGGPVAAAGFTIRNQTGKALIVGFRVRGARSALESLLRLRLGNTGSPLADTTLQGLRRGSASTVRLASGSTRRLRVEAWIPADVTDGYEGQQAVIALTPTIRAAA
jgi:hypothetical protein